jgi:hypothetical protein
MIRLVLLLASLCLAACNAPGPHFRGLPATRVTVDGSVFDVRVRDRLAEAMRVNTQYAPRFGPIRERAGRAMALVSGCEVAEVRGDQALATGILDCGDGPPRRRSPTAELDCVVMEGTLPPLFPDPATNLDCRPA